MPSTIPGRFHNIEGDYLLNPEQCATLMDHENIYTILTGIEQVSGESAMELLWARGQGCGKCFAARRDERHEIIGIHYFDSDGRLICVMYIQPDFQVNFIFPMKDLLTRGRSYLHME